MSKHVVWCVAAIALLSLLALAQGETGPAAFQHRELVQRALDAQSALAVTVLEHVCTQEQLDAIEAELVPAAGKDAKRAAFARMLEEAARAGVPAADALTAAIQAKIAELEEIHP